MNSEFSVIKKIMDTNKIVGRFAPSPSGRMHLGNIYAALLSWLSAKKKGGSWIIRIEDLDRQRCKKHFADILIEDLAWLGLKSDDEILYQSKRDNFYISALKTLENQSIVYDCYCTRADIRASAAPHLNDGNFVYSGNCKRLTDGQISSLSAVRKPCKRLIVDDNEISFEDFNYGFMRAKLTKLCGDFVIRRSDGNFSYQLAVTVDDALQGVTEVVRGRDLIPSTFQQIFLYRKLNFNVPKFGHLPLLISTDGRRLSKRDLDMDMNYFRNNFRSEQLIGYIMSLCGFCAQNTSLNLDEALSIFDWKQLPNQDIKNIA